MSRKAKSSFSVGVRPIFFGDFFFPPGECRGWAIMLYSPNYIIAFTTVSLSFITVCVCCVCGFVCVCVCVCVSHAHHTSSNKKQDIMCVYTHSHAHTHTNTHAIPRSPATSVKRDLLQCEKRPTKETYSVKRDLRSAPDTNSQTSVP